MDIGQGFAHMGESMSKWAGAASLDMLRSQSEEQRIRLADELAGARQEKQNAFTSSERKDTQTFTAGENEKQRALTASEGAANRASHEKTAAMSAAASMANAALSAQVQREGQAIQKEALTPTEVRVAKWFAEASPEEKTAFQETLLAKMPRNQPPEGFRKTDSGNLEPIPGGPKDPDYIAKESTAKGKDAPSGYRSTGDGKLEFIPGGPADPSIMKRAAPMNNEQARDAGFADRMMNSQSILRDLDKQGTNAWGRISEGLGKGGNYLQSEEYQKFRQAKEDFINAQLRRESGAAISADEFTKADRQYFPQPGDTPAMVAQKDKNRQLAVDAMIRGAGPSYKPGPNVDAPAAAAPPAPASKQQEVLSAPPPVEQRVIGRIYQSPNGPRIWMGNGWAVAPMDNK